MSTKSIITYRNWTFEINQKLTQSIYNNILCGKASMECTKLHENFINNRNTFFPKEVLDLFVDLGIDYTKDTRINPKVTENGQICYEGNFQFIGNLVKGDSCKIEINNEHTVFELSPINDHFSIGFHQDDTPFFNQHVIHVEFSITEPKTIASRRRETII